jgi:hypothetical protein
MTEPIRRIRSLRLVLLTSCISSRAISESH